MYLFLTAFALAMKVMAIGLFWYGFRTDDDSMVRIAWWALWFGTGMTFQRWLS